MVDVWGGSWGSAWQGLAESVAPSVGGGIFSAALSIESIYHASTPIIAVRYNGADIWPAGPIIPVLEQWEIYPDGFNYSIPRDSYGETVGHLHVLLYFSSEGTAPPEAGGLADWTRFIHEGNIGLKATLAAYYWIGEEGTYGNLGFADSGKPGFAAILRFSGFDSTAPIGAATSSQYTSSSPESPSATAPENDAFVIRVMCADDDDAAAEDTGYPAGTTGLFLRERGASGPTAGVAVETADAGLIGSAAWASLVASEEIATATIVINAKLPSE